jgi:L-aspartate oxidase
LNKEEFIKHFPTIYDKCVSIGVDPMIDMIPVVPACHYICGGIKTDVWGRTSIHNLYACGECTNTGLHGANRLASNSLLEGLVFGHRIFLELNQRLDNIDWKNGIPEWNAEGTSDPKELVLLTQSLKELKEIMTSYVGIVRSDTRLERAYARLHILYEETEKLYNTTTISPQLCELRNLITIAYLITRSAGIRKESRGLHYNTDYQQKMDFIDNTIL